MAIFVIKPPKEEFGYLQSLKKVIPAMILHEQYRNCVTIFIKRPA